LAWKSSIFVNEEVQDSEYDVHQQGTYPIDNGAEQYLRARNRTGGLDATIAD